MHAWIAVVWFTLAFGTHFKFGHLFSESPCESLPCQNGGTCRPLYDTNSYVCQCGEGNNGTYCENECHKALGMASGAIANEQINASSLYDVNHSAHQGRLFFKETKIKSGSWSVKRHDLNQSSWLQIDLNNKYTKVLGVSTQGRDSNPQWPGGVTFQWVTRYNLQYSDDGVIFQHYKEEGQAAEKEFRGNNDRGTVVYHELNPPIRARYIRFRPMAWHGWISMRAELYGCKGSWQNINANPLCFGAKNNSFGTFAIHKPGHIYRLKLVHHSGYVNCISDSASATKWGCSASGYAKKVNVHITDENNNRVFPTAGSVSFDPYYFYELPGFDANSAEIVLDFFPAPLSVAAGQKFRIWYGEDLMKSAEGNNIGKSCVDVYGFY
ncbi:lactadherin-like isoform X2 [Montipora capricornis]|uniref:lactadherin-like isoform X2 n=1 Tax=Montipora capricornis TaxID=246305 RepID=UPI0035F1B733